jgi:hypothetical protein
MHERHVWQVIIERGEDLRDCDGGSKRKPDTKIRFRIFDSKATSTT